jgi:hypothetical protein
VAVKFGISNQPDKTMKLLTNLTTVALTLSIATSVAAEQLPQVPNPNVILPANVPTATQPASAPKLKNPRLLTVEQKAEFDERVRSHDTVRAVLKLALEVKGTVAEISVETCLKAGYKSILIGQCPMYIEAMQNLKDTHKEYLEYIESSHRDEMNFLTSINNRAD